MPLKNFYDYIAASRLRTIIFLFAISFIVRIAVAIPAITFDVPLMTDEISYFDRAVGYEKILSELSNGRMPPTSSRAVNHAYGRGMWPPLNAFLFGLGFFLFGKHIAVARLLLVVISSLTTPLVYLLTSKLTTKKAAIIAALIHIFYPSFIAYSHILFSETLYIFLLLCAVYFTVLLSDEQFQLRKRTLYAIFCGMFLGLCGLTRPAVLALLVMVPFWLVVFIKGKNLKLILPGIVVVSYLIVLSPWQTALMVREKNPGILSNITGWYMHIGNNPWIPEGYGSSWLHDSRLKMLKTAREYKKIHSISTDQAQRELALQEIKGNFKAFLIRAIYKFRMLWSMDFFLLMHFYQTAYPPVHYAFAALLSITVLISYLMLLLLAVFGFLIADSKFSKKSLLLVLLIACIAPTLIVFGVFRFHIPLLALLLPVAGYGAVNLNQKTSVARKVVIAAISLTVCFSVFTSLPLIVSAYLEPSTYYCGLVSRVDKILGSDTTCTDKIVIRARNTYPAYRLNIEILSDGFLLNPTQEDVWTHVPKTIKYNWEVIHGHSVLLLDIYSNHTSTPLEISASSESLKKSVIIQPIRRLNWRQWQPSGLNGIEYMWLGGGVGVRNKLPDDDLFKFKLTSDFIS